MYKNLKTAYISNVKNSYIKENFTNSENIYIKENFTDSETVKNCINNFYNLGIKKFKKDFYDSGEIPERMSVFYFLEPNNKVLEIGGSVGGVSEVIATKLNNPKNLVVLEPSNESFIKLTSLAKKYNFNVFNGPLVNENENLNCFKTSNDYYKCEKVDFKVDNNATFKKLQDMYNINFDTLVIDCEGCYENILEENFKNGNFNNIKKIFIEWDGKILEELFFKEGFKLIAMLPHTNLEKGNRVYVR